MKIQGMTLDGYTLVFQSGKHQLERYCPKCKECRPISAFGLRLMSGKKEIRLQAQCTDCRSRAE